MELAYRLSPMRLFTPTRLYWFGAGPSEADLLARWRDVPLQAFDIEHGDWHSDGHTVVLAERADAVLFACAADALMRYQFYPPSVMHHGSDAALAGRPLRPGDRIVQRIHVIRLFGLPVVDVLTMNVVTDVVDTPRCKGFTYATTEQHSEQGTWSAAVEWRDDDALVVHMRAVSRARPRERRWLRPFMRRLQRRAHRLGLATFAEQVRRQNGG